MNCSYSMSQIPKLVKKTCWIIQKPIWTAPTQMVLVTNWIRNPNNILRVGYNCTPTLHRAGNHWPIIGGLLPPHLHTLQRWNRRKGHCRARPFLDVKMALCIHRGDVSILCMHPSFLDRIATQQLELLPNRWCGKKAVFWVFRALIALTISTFRI